MKMPRSAFAHFLAASLMLVACADENDPATWAKRLDEQSQRAPAVKKLNEMFNAAMGTANNNRDDAKVKAVTDASVEGLTKTYTTGGLDEKTRTDLIKLLADMGDPRAAPAFAKALRDFEPGKNDEDVKFAAQGASRLAQANKLSDQQLIDALWDCFAKFRPSQAKSIQLVQDLQGAIKTVKHPSWGPKAVSLLAAPVDPTKAKEASDQLEFLQKTAVQLIGDTKFTAGIAPMIKTLLTPTKQGLTFPVRLALQRMPKEAEPELIKALKGEGDYAKAAETYPEKAYMPLIAEPLAYISRPAGQAAIMEALGGATTDQNRVALAMYLTYYPADAKTMKAYTDAYTKVGPTSAIPLMKGGNGRALLTSTAAHFYDASMTDWILREVAAAPKGEAADAMPALAYPAAMKLMMPEQAKAVGDAVKRIEGAAVEKEMYKSANDVLEKCKKDAACYVGVLETPVPSSPAAAKTGHVKAAWMLAMLKATDTKAKLVERIEKERDPSVRLAMLESVDALSPQGDAATAAKLEKIVETEVGASGKPANATDEMYRIALKLRSRVP